MSDESHDASEARSAGTMLRAARERQGLHIAALAAAIKVPPAKLEALEAGRYEGLTDATFVRALAQSVCRVLKIDAKPVLELLPSAGNSTLERVEHSLRAPFHDRPGRATPTETHIWQQPVFWVVALLLLAAAGFLLWPQRASLWASIPGTSSPTAAQDKPAPAATPPAATTPAQVAPAAPVVQAPAPPAPVAANEVPAAAAVTAPTASTPVITETVHDVPATAAADAPAGLAVVRTREPSWVEAHDARGTVLLSRVLQPGEAVGLDGALPLRLVIGNAPATEVTMRGKRVTLGAPNRDNVVRVELK